MSTKTKVRVFISQPMNGKSDEEILQERSEAINYVNSRILNTEIEFIDSFFIKAPIDSNPLWFLGKSIELLSSADIAYFVDGWEEARGCRIEHKLCENYGISILKKV